MIEFPRHNRRCGNDILIAPIPRHRETNDPPPLGLQLRTQLGHRLHRSRVVPVIEDHFERVFFKHIQPPRRLEIRGRERAQPLANILQRLAHRMTNRRCEHRVLHVVHRLAVNCRRDQMRPHQLNIGRVFVDRNHVAVHALLKHQRPPAHTHVFAHQRVVCVHCHVTNIVRLGMPRHFQTQLIVGIQNGGIGRNFNNNPFDPRQIFNGFNAFQPQMIGIHIQNRPNIAAFIAHATAQQTTPRRFQNRGVHRGITQNHLRRTRARQIAFDRQIAVDINTVCCRQANGIAAEFMNMRHHA